MKPNIEKKYFIIAVILYSLIWILPVSAQRKTGLTHESYLKAREIFNAGINALGGMENIRRADKISIYYRSVGHPVGQNAAFGAPSVNALRTGAKTLIDFSGNRYVTEG
jgi:hypothetical protein